jgi:hypothetical protein
MPRTWTLPLALALASGLAAQSPEKLSIHFPLGSAEPYPADVVAIGALCGRIERDLVRDITLQGHTDPSGSAAYNKLLRERRAERVRELLLTTCLAAKPVRTSTEEIGAPSSAMRTGTHAEARRVDVLLEFNSPVTEDRPAPTPRRAPPGVRPLLPAIDQRSESHTVDPTGPIDLTMSDGVRVRIPAGAIVDANGATVSGPVDLSYRGFDDPYAIIASGIPMHVKTAEGVGHMESAGMFELYASRAGEPLQLALGNSINFEQPAAEALDPEYTGWQLDQATGEWRPGGELVRAPLGDPSRFTAATIATNRYWRRLFQMERQAPPDSTTFDDRRSSASYCHLTACDTSAPWRSWIKRRDRFEDNGGVPEITVVAYKGIYDPDRIVFTVRVDNPHDRQFPEWRRLPYPAIWEYTGPEPRRVFKRLYGRRHLFQDLQLELSAGTDDGILRLKENGEWLDLPVSAHWNRVTDKKAERWDRSIALYAKALARRETLFNREVARATSRYRKQFARRHATSWSFAKREMNRGEREMGLDSWMAYAMDRPLEMDASAGASPWTAFAKERTSINMYGFGSCNIDRMLVMPEQMNVLASTIDEQGHPFPWVRAYAVPKGKRAVITYQGIGNGKNDMLLVAPGLMHDLFLVDAEGNVARAGTAPLNSREPRVTLNVERLRDVKSLDELRTMARK